MPVSNPGLSEIRSDDRELGYVPVKSFLAIRERATATQIEVGCLPIMNDLEHHATRSLRQSAGRQRETSRKSRKPS
jgi:hypothetical protein